MREIILKRGKEESILRHHPWVFSGAIAKLPDGLEEGDLAVVKGSDGNVLGIGHYQIGSIAVRLLEFGTDILPEDFFHKRLEASFRLRQTFRLIRDDNN